MIINRVETAGYNSAIIEDAQFVMHNLAYGRIYFLSKTMRKITVFMVFPYKDIKTSSALPTSKGVADLESSTLSKPLGGKNGNKSSATPEDRSNEV